MLDLLSVEFYVIVVALLLIYHRLRQHLQKYLLLGVSYILIFSVSWEAAAILLAHTAIMYGLAFWVASDGPKKKPGLLLSVLVNVGVLALFRQQNFFIRELEDAANTIGLGGGGDSIKLLAPLGLSYYVLETLAYHLDIYRGNALVINRLHVFALYLAYFPKFIAGPIERADDFIQRLDEQKHLSNEIVKNNILLILIGLVRKLLFANALTSLIPPGLFSRPDAFSSVELWLGLFAYGFAIYNDFAGYTNIACGISGLFGISLSRNFARPYFASNFSDFWNRWHISLSHWLRDYIYLPLTRALLRRGLRRWNPVVVVTPLLATMMISGLWHGLALHFVLWGALHGVYQSGERYYFLNRKKSPAANTSAIRQILAAGAVAVLVMIAWVPFRIPSGQGAVDYWSSLFTSMTLTRPDGRIVLMLAASLWMDSLQARHQRDVFLLNWKPLAQILCTALLILMVIWGLGSSETPQFIYEGF